MKKIIAALIPVLFIWNLMCVEKARATYVTSLIAMAGNAATYASGAFKVPAYASVAATVSGVTSQAVKWLPMVIPQARAAKIITSILVVGGSALVGYATSELSKYLQEKGYGYDENGVLSETDPYGVAGDGSIDVTPDIGPDSYGHVGVYPNREAAVAAGELFRAALNYMCSGYDQEEGSTYDQNPVYDVYKCTPMYGGASSFYWYPDPSVTPQGTVEEEMSYSAANPGDVEATVNGDLGSGDPNAILAGLEALNIVGDAVSNPNHGLRSNQQEWSAIEDELYASITEDQKAEVLGEYVDEQTWAETAGESTNLNSDYLTQRDVKNAVIEALTAKGISKAEAQAAIEAAIAAKADVFAGTGGLTIAQTTQAIVDALEAKGITQASVKTAVAEAIEEADAVPPDDPVITPPTKNDLTSMLTGFMNGLGNLAILDVLDTIGVEESGGSSTLCIDIPSSLGGGQSCHDFSSWSASLILIGNLLLSINCIVWIMFLFKD